MSRENVEVVRRLYDAAERTFEAYWKDPRSLVAALQEGDLYPEAREVLSYLDPEVEWNPVFSALIGGTRRGHLEFLRGWDEWLAATEDYRISLHELADFGDDRVFAVLNLAYKAKSTGIHVNTRSLALLTVREGLIVRFDPYRDRSEALKAAGLSE
jgi:ketosteroid isomerase-like protein